MVITAPARDWLNSSQSMLAGDHPNDSCSRGADWSSAEREVRSASCPSSRKAVSSAAPDPAPTCAAELTAYAGPVGPREALGGPGRTRDGVRESSGRDRVHHR